MTTLTDLVAAMQAREAARAAKGEPPAYIVEADATGTPVTWGLPGHGLVNAIPTVGACACGMVSSSLRRGGATPFARGASKRQPSPRKSAPTRCAARRMIAAELAFWPAPSPINAAFRSGETGSAGWTSSSSSSSSFSA